MKKIAFTAMIGILGLVFTACSSDFDENLLFIEQKEQPKDTIPTKPEPEEPKDTVDNTPNVWNTVLGRTATINTTGHVTSYMFVGGTKVERDTLTLEYDLVAGFGGKLFFTSEATPQVGTIRPTEFTYGEPSTREDGVSVKSEQGKTIVNFGFYDRTLDVERILGNLPINGKSEDFWWTSYKVKATSSLIEKKDSVERNDSIFRLRTFRDEAVIIFNDYNKYSVSAETVVETFLKLKEKEEPKPETMPTPDLWVDKFVSVDNITFSPTFSGNKVSWHKVCRVVSNSKVDFWVDGTFVGSDARANGKYNSLYYAENAWRQAYLTNDGNGGWSYTFYVNGTPKVKNIDQNMALTSGLQNFRQDNNASQTPSVYTTTEVKTYSGKKYITVTGWDKDNKPVITFTIGEK